uniref:Uncharacterized protein n=1 Tax=Panagrolaimus sp. JU765 TaxID=591449 RepID=A0AC34Q1X9_9BILA
KRKYDLKVKECDDLKEKYKNIPPRFAKIRKVDPQ